MLEKVVVKWKAKEENVKIAASDLALPVYGVIKLILKDKKLMNLLLIAVDGLLLSMKTMYMNLK